MKCNGQVTCKICNKRLFNGSAVLRTGCIHYCHQDCLRVWVTQISPYLDKNQLKSVANCQASDCGKRIEINRIYQVFGGEKSFDQLSEKLNFDLAQNINQQWQQEVRNQLIEEAKKKTFDCPICMEQLRVNDDCITLPCEHKYCKNCLIDHIKSKLYQENINCPYCSDTPLEQRKVDGYFRKDANDVSIPTVIIQSLISREEFDKWNQFKFSQFRSPDPKSMIVHCPSFLDKNWNKLPEDILKKIFKHEKTGVEVVSCPMVFEWKNDGRDEQFQQCKTCGYSFCVLCSDEKHEKFTCQQRQQWRLDNERGDKAIEEMIRREPNRLRRCTKCGSLIEKMSGCDRVPCINKDCGAQICWKCMKWYPTPVECYNHMWPCKGVYVP